MAHDYCFRLQALEKLLRDCHTLSPQIDSAENQVLGRLRLDSTLTPQTLLRQQPHLQDTLVNSPERILRTGEDSDFYHFFCHIENSAERILRTGQNSDFYHFFFFCRMENSAERILRIGQNLDFQLILYLNSSVNKHTIQYKLLFLPYCGEVVTSQL